jgi:hypothetical protein
MSAAADGTFRLLWCNLNGQASVWTLGSSDLFVSAQVFGPV